MEQKKTNIPNFKTMILQCLNCGSDFLKTETPQLFFWRKSFANPTRYQEYHQQRCNIKGGNK